MKVLKHVCAILAALSLECKWCHEKFSSIKELVTGPCTRNNPTRMMLHQIKED